jgi:hypothetical protein
MFNFTDEKEVFVYIKNKFSKESKLILVRGSTATKPVKKFGDFDIEVWTIKLKKPYYEITFIKEKPILISVYFYKYKEGKEIQKPSNVKILYGKYNNKLEPDFNKDTYTSKEKIKRECQLIVDFFFKYLRTKDKKYLQFIQKRI